MSEPKDRVFAAIMVVVISTNVAGAAAAALSGQWVIASLGGAVAVAAAVLWGRG